MSTRDPDYCSYCCGDAKKHGRAVHMTDVCDYPICGLCERRAREGLIRYRPSNGAEMMMFESRCDKCRHFITDEKMGSLEAPFNACQWGVLDRLYVMQMSERDHISNWFSPDDIENGCPATCRRFTHKNDSDGERRDPPRPDCEGQMFLGDLNIPVESAAVKRIAVSEASHV